MVERSKPTSRPIPKDIVKDIMRKFDKKLIIGADSSDESDEGIGSFKDSESRQELMKQ
jgi:hypothetical protein